MQVFHLRLPTVAQLGTARGDKPSTFRELVFVRLQDRDGAVGWGECSALNEVGYSNESAVTARKVLSSVAGGHAAPDDQPMASACLEMAATDMRLRRAGTSLAGQLGVTRTRVPAGAALGLGTTDEILAQASTLVQAGYQRLKLKIAPGSISPAARAIATSYPELEIHVDANGSLGSQHLPELLTLSDFGVAAIEQPFAIQRPDLAAELASHTSMLVVADEAAPTLSAAQALHANGALSAISIKPPRVGGTTKAVELLQWANSQGLKTTAGGMLESALGRHALAAFAALDGVTLTGDLSPSRRWLAADPWPDLALQDGHIVVPTTPGIAPLPDLSVLDEYTIGVATGSFQM